MGSIRNTTFTKPLPANAEVFVVKGETFAKVKPPKGRAVTYPAMLGKDSSQRIAVTSATYVAKFRDDSGIIQKVSTNCRGEGCRGEGWFGQSWPNWNAAPNWRSRES